MQSPCQKQGLNLFYLHDLHFGVKLAMTLLLPVTCFGVIFEDNLRAVVAVLRELRFHRDARKIRHADLDFAVLALQKDLIKNDGLAFGDAQLLHFQFLSGGNFILLSSGLYDSEIFCHDNRLRIKEF